MDDNNKLQDHYMRWFNKIKSIDQHTLDCYCNEIQKANENFSTYRTELIDFLIAEYIEEVWKSESPPASHVNTTEVVDWVVESCGSWWTDVYICIKLGINKKTWQKIKNLHRATQRFNQTTTEKDFLNQFNIDYIKSLHNVIGFDIIDDAGKFRTSKVKANGSSVVYSAPNQIMFRLENLIRFYTSKVKEAPETTKDRMEYKMKLASFFFSEFLLIHPFSNGNGRTARILLNLLLQFDVPVPFSLYHKGRSEYVRVLESRGNGEPPSELFQYLLCSCNRTAAQVNWISMGYS